MKLRTPLQMLADYDAATKENPLVIRNGESDIYRQAMMLRCKQEDDRIRKANGFCGDSKLTVFDADKLLKNGVKSPIDGSVHGNRATYKDHLKRHGCVEVGNDFNNAKPRTDIRGDFNCREELSKATHQIMDKYNG